MSIPSSGLLLQLRPSNIHGLGCHTTTKIGKGEVAGVWRGELIPTPARPGEKYYGYYVKIGEKWLVPTERPEIHINHSCDPNTSARKLIDGLEFKAVRDIMEGEELSFDYGTVITKGDDFTFKCNCGGKNCRKTIIAL